MNVIMKPRAESISFFIHHKHTKIKFIFQISMSQAVSPDLEPSPDLISALTGPLQQETDSCEDIPATPGSASSPESLVHHESTGDVPSVDSCIGETAEVTNQTEMETPAEDQLIECDQPVSLDPEITEDVEVCNVTSDDKQNQILSCLVLHKAREEEPCGSFCLFQHFRACIKDGQSSVGNLLRIYSKIYSFIRLFS